MVLYYIFYFPLSIHNILVVIDKGNFILYYTNNRGGNTMKENLRKLREDLGLTQAEMAEKLKVSVTTISRLELGTRTITERMIYQICKEFNVSQEWFETGKGNMYIDLSLSANTEIAALMGEVLANDDEFLKRVFLTFAKLSDSERNVVKKIIEQLHKK
ncbi:helix-turn-helix domain-containing protein [Clostridium tarantellae]|uniref:Helix-turn-helix domain-containing protein n=2 Tax=Clostridium tarantellae TaxID=39493 RepID=A0A6I1MRE2_9CLOT|nr:helix-turn-helix domain-containing protein [Clostridium tarantellae]